VRIIVGLSIALLTVWLVGELVGVGTGLLWARRRTRWAFRRRLRRNGLSDEVIEEIARRYHPPGLIRQLIREARS